MEERILLQTRYENRIRDFSLSSPEQLFASAHEQPSNGLHHPWSSLLASPGDLCRVNAASQLSEDDV
jgi:hypothetical protein